MGGPGRRTHWGRDLKEGGGQPHVAKVIMATEADHDWPGPVLQMLTSQAAQGREGQRAHCTDDVQGHQLLSGKAGIKPRLSVSII